LNPSDEHRDDSPGAATPASPPSTPAAPATLLLAALRDEIWPCVKALSLSPTQQPGRYSSLDGTVIARYVGIGAQRALAALHEEHRRGPLRQVVHLGFAGGLDPELKPGELIEPSWVADESGACVAVRPGEERPPYVPPRSMLLTLGRLADSPQTKRTLFEASGAGAVDMESLHSVRWAASCDMPIRLLRAISDPANTALPAAAATWVRPDGTADVGRAMAYLARHPLMAATLMKLNSASKAGARALAQRVAQWLSDDA
jgi:hypothetical protein